MKTLLESNLRIWWASRKLLRMKWTLELGCIILLLIFTLGLASDLVDLKYIFQFLAFFHGCLVSILYTSLFSNTNYPMFPGGPKKGIFFSLAELLSGWVQLSAAYTFLQYYLESPGTVNAQNLLSFALLWGAGWIVVRIAQKFYIISVLSLPIYILGINFVDHIINYHVYLIFMGLTLASSYAQLTQKKQIGTRSGGLLAKQKNTEKKPQSWMRELVSLGPKTKNISAFPNVPKLAFFSQALIANAAVLALMILASLSMFFVLELFSTDIHKAFGGDTRTFAYIFCSLFCALMGAFNSDMLENGVPCCMSLSRHSWLKLRRTTHVLNQSAGIIAIVIVPLMVEVVLNLIIDGRFVVTNQYWLSLLIAGGIYPLIGIASILFRLANARKLFSQNRSTNWIESKDTTVQTSQILILLGGIVVTVVCFIAVMYLFATNVLTYEFLMSVRFAIPALFSFAIVLILIQFAENKLEARSLLKGDLV